MRAANPILPILISTLALLSTPHPACADGACCTPNASATCTIEAEAICTSGGGNFQGEGTTCTPNPCPVVLTPFLDALPLPAVATPTSGSAGGTATYDLAMREIQQQLHTDLPATTVWGYGDGPSGATYPGPTIEARSGQPVTVHWLNDLRDTSVGGDPLRTSHYLPVDTCPHGADDPSVRTVVHLHGGHVPAEFDGHPEDTFTPFAPDNTDTYVYPNNQSAGTIWYHDHALGITRLNVYMGLAGFYLVRDVVEDALLCPAAQPTDPCLPAGEFEVPLVIQDRTFNPDGSLAYPANWADLFFGDTILVNGKVWPVLEVKQGKYRFRVLNGSNSRTYTLALSNGAPFDVVGQEGGLFESPVSITEITLAPAERAEMIVDFAPYGAGTDLFLENSAPAPFPGTPGAGVVPDVMKFHVVSGGSPVTNPVPDPLRTMEVLDEGDAILSRTFELAKNTSDPCTTSATRWEVISTDGINGAELGKRWGDVTEYPELGTTEIWSFINRSGMMHPMHMHLDFFQVLDREAISIVSGDIVPSGVRVPPPPEESGWKDTVKVGRREIVRLIMRFEDYTGLFPYHCHILEHEDHEMMRQLRTVSCGDGALDPTEECDDGNGEAGDGCSPGCELEYELVLYGFGQGGSVSLDVGGEPISVPTSPGDDVFAVVIAIANAINTDPVLMAAGVTAFADGRRVVTIGEITDIVITDPGLSTVPPIPALSWWGVGLLGALVAGAGLAAVRSSVRG